MKELDLSKEDLINAFTTFYIFVASAILYFFITDYLPENIYVRVLEYLFVILFVSVIKLSRRVFIKDESLISRVEFLVFKFNSKKILISQIKDVVLKQNEEQYFEIKAIKNDYSEFLIKKLPNKNPALKELELIKSYLNIT